MPKAFEALSTASRVPDSGILPEVALVTLASRTGRPVQSEWWQAMRNKLSNQRPTAGNDEALKSLTLCQRDGHCVVDDDQMLQVYLVAVGRGDGTAASLYSYAIFAFGRLKDSQLALDLTREAAEKSGDLQYRLNLADFLISLGRGDEALEQLAIIKTRDRYGIFASDIAIRENKMRVK